MSAAVEKKSGQPCRIVRMVDGPVRREPRPIRSTTEPRTFRCAGRFDACLESGVCCFPGRCENDRSAA